jgi:hypothetical protein
MAAGGSDVRGAAMRNPLDVKKIASKKTNSTRLLPFHNVAGSHVTVLEANDQHEGP